MDWSWAASQQKSRSRHEIISVTICSIWLMWQKKAAQVTIRDAQLKPYIRLLRQSPNSIFFLHPIYFCAPSEFRGWLCKDVNKWCFFFCFFFIVHIQGTQKNYESLSVFVPSEGTEQWASTWALVRVLSADVIQCVHSCIQVRTLTFITELFISISARHVWTWRTLLGLLLLSLLISCYICSLSMQEKKHHWQTTVGFILRNSFPHIPAFFLSINLEEIRS